jgi:tetratricopeptide (TPR) repeat protein
VKQQAKQFDSRLAGLIVIVLLGVLSYWPALSGQFVWDDNSWTTEILPILRDFSGLEKIWFQPTALQQYYPLSGTTFWIDYHLWGFHPLPYHVENILLHLTSAILFWQLLRKLQVPGAWLAGAIFAIHPVMVESVAWITERKNVLSMVLFLSSLLAYGRFSGYWNEPEPKRDWWAWGLALVLFCAALLAKATAFSLPAVLLLICWWKRGTIRFKRDVLPTLPFFVISIGFCLGTSWLEKNHVGAKGPDWQISFPARCLIAGRAIWFYVGKLLWPSQLCFLYPRWHLNTGSWKQWMLPISVIAILLTLWQLRGRIGRGPLTACLFFIGTLFPALGFMNAYFMTYSFVCDHWVYLSSLGFFALFAAVITHLAARLRQRELLYGFTAVLLGVCGYLTWQQCGVYSNIETMWRDTLAKNPDSWLAHNNLGLILAGQGKILEAMAEYQEAIRLDPNFPQSQNNLGVLMKQTGHTDAAIAQYEIALRLRPDYAEARDNLANALRAMGKIAEAMEQYELAVQIQPYNADAHYSLANALKHEGKNDEAMEQYEETLNIDPDFFNARCNLAVMFLQLGKGEEAAGQFAEAVRIEPNAADAHYGLAVALSQSGQSRQAIEQWQIALNLNPKYPEALNALALTLATVGPDQGGDVEQAVALARRACDLTGYRAPAFIDTLAVAYAAAGRLDDAIAADTQALNLAKSGGRSRLAAEIQNRLNQFHSAASPSTASTVPSN